MEDRGSNEKARSPFAAAFDPRSAILYPLYEFAEAGTSMALGTRAYFGLHGLAVATKLKFCPSPAAAWICRKGKQLNALRPKQSSHCTGRQVCLGRGGQSALCGSARCPGAVCRVGEKPRAHPH